MSKKQKKDKTAPIHPHRGEIEGFLFLSLSLALFLSLLSFAFAEDSFNWLGLIGFVIGSGFHYLFGLGSYLICFFCAWIGWRLFLQKKINRFWYKVFSFSLLLLSICVLLTLVENRYPTIGHFAGELFYTKVWAEDLTYHLGGIPFYYLYHDLPKYNFFRIFNIAGIALIFSTTLISSILLLTKVSLAEALSRLCVLAKKAAQAIYTLSQKIYRAIPPLLDILKPRIFPLLTAEAASVEEEEISFEISSHTEIEEPVFEEEEFDLPPPPKPAVKVSAPSPSRREKALRAQEVHNGNFEKYDLPPLPLLTSPKKVDQALLKKDLKRRAGVLEETLASFGIEAKVGQVNCGPTITSFEVHPAIGVKVQKVKALEKDIALNMKAQSLRLLAPIPGKAAIGIEVPNANPQEVSFKELIQAYQKGSKKFHIPILLGKTVTGEYVMNDLARMPHCIIAGATGSGKSVCINTIIMSILLNARPDEIKLIMVDPKKVELTPYTKLPHMLAPVITEPQGACSALNWLVKEMTQRYEQLKLLRVRNIEAYNNRTIDQELENSYEREFPEKLPYIVCIIDELADLMMVASSDIETPIARIAQMARAVGIHLILATQRPSREVITGIIKANFPTRIAFKVASRINSQIILDEVGAESLLGNGDLLFLPPGTSHLTRAQGAFIRDEDINRVVDQICEQAPPNYLIKSFDAMEGFSSPAEMGEGQDSLFLKAKEIVLSTGNASTTFLQRKLNIGYPRAASIMDELEEQGVVTPQEGNRARKVVGAQN